ncbi:uncharacterized protein LOC119870456 isoform X1 [Canis lupus familiaris]|uniref:uncharacterized protein LOC119870456 isoform X1 n=1 Tax=Canis lupus familiaris TaxID=9615 RepID=UPI0018F47452|nr:uncharacterized protein LOC119870456 isoform X1 [Canis lupus familiaris]
MQMSDLPGAGRSAPPSPTFTREPASVRLSVCPCRGPRESTAHGVLPAILPSWLAGSHPRVTCEATGGWRVCRTCPVSPQKEPEGRTVRVRLALLNRPRAGCGAASRTQGLSPAWPVARMGQVHGAGSREQGASPRAWPRPGCGDPGMSQAQPLPSGGSCLELRVGPRDREPARPDTLVTRVSVLDLGALVGVISNPWTRWMAICPALEGRAIGTGRPSSWSEEAGARITDRSGFPVLAPSCMSCASLGLFLFGHAVWGAPRSSHRVGSSGGLDLALRGCEGREADPWLKLGPPAERVESCRAVGELTR